MRRQGFVFKCANQQSGTPSTKFLIICYIFISHWNSLGNQSKRLNKSLYFDVGILFNAKIRSAKTKVEALKKKKNKKKNSETATCFSIRVMITNYVNIMISLYALSITAGMYDASEQLMQLNRGRGDDVESGT